VNKNLDFLRAFAVLLVFAGHALAFFDRLGPYGPLRLATLGALGVLLFFVHTSLVLMQSLEREPGAAKFFIRRIFRVYPLAIVVILLIAIFRLPQATIGPHHFSGFTFDFEDLIANLSLTQNFSLRTPILGPTWSLCYEMQMYVFLPFLFVMARSMRAVIALYLASVGIAFLGLHYSATPNLSFFAPCFLSGILAYRLMKGSGHKLPAFCWPIFVALLSLLYFSVKNNHYNDYLLCLVLGVGVPRFEQISSPALARVSHCIAKYSYGIYLTHFACLYLAFERLRGQPFALQFVVFVSLFVALSMVLYHGIEEPFIRLGKRITRSNPSSSRVDSTVANLPLALSE